MFCPSCGKDLPAEARFCPECGHAFAAVPAQPTLAPRRPVVPQTAPETRAPRSKPSPATYRSRPQGSRAFLSAILVLAVLAAGFAVVSVATWGSYDEVQTYVHDPGAPEGAASWSIQADTARVAVRYTSDPAAPAATVTVHLQGSGPFLAGKTASDVYLVSFDNASLAKSVSLARKDPFTFPWLENSSITVTLKAGTTYTIAAQAVTGSISLDVPANQTLDGISLGSTTGSARVALAGGVAVSGNLTASVVTGSVSFAAGTNTSITGDLHLSAITGSIDMGMAAGTSVGGTLRLITTTGSIGASLMVTTLGGDVSLNTTTGSITLHVVNMTASSNLRLDAGVVTGSITATFVQQVAAGANFTSQVNSVTGSINVSFEGVAAHTSARFVASEGSGTPAFTNQGGFETLPGNAIFQSIQQDRPNRMDFALQTTTGSIAIAGKMA